MSEQHTPGPWFIWKELAMQLEGLGADEIDDEMLMFSEHEICAGAPSKCTRGSMSGHTHTICRVDADEFGDDEHSAGVIALANARLIAAAPNLLAALKTLIDCAKYGPVSDSADAWIDARAAIAKVEGGGSGRACT